jgi:hypothetical protein
LSSDAMHRVSVPFKKDKHNRFQYRYLHWPHVIHCEKHNPLVKPKAAGPRGFNFISYIEYTAVDVPLVLWQLLFVAN